MNSNIWIATGLTLLAGMATGIGSIIAFTAKRTNYRFLSVATGFSAGVMLYVAFVEIFFKGGEALAKRYGEATGNWINVASFFGGILLIGLIDQLIPSAENPHEVPAESETRPLHLRTRSPAPAAPDHKKLLRTGLFTALAITIHNFPEGLATFLAALEDPTLGLAIAVAIALHNIPEGISVSVPIYYATGNRRRAFVYSFLSGLAEPVGAAVGYLLIRFFTADADGAIPSEVMGILFGGVAGIMVYISLDELLPTSRAYGKGHDSIFGLVGGMAVMALSLLLMA
jgi:zinc transporter, ZIP family